MTEIIICTILIFIFVFWRMLGPGIIYTLIYSIIVTAVSILMLYCDSISLWENSFYFYAIIGALSIILILELHRLNVLNKISSFIKKLKTN